MVNSLELERTIVCTILSSLFNLKGQSHEIFDFRFIIRAVSNFFENSQLKVHHRAPVSLTPVANGKNL
jgi:hypothetical protein